MKLKRIDSISMDQTYYTDEGYLVDHPIVTTFEMLYWTGLCEGELLALTISVTCE